MDNLCGYIDDELMELDKKAKNGKLSAGDIEMGDKLAHFKKSLLTNEAMESGYSNENGMRREYSRDYSMNDDYRRDYSRDDYSTARRRRDSMGRYSKESDDIVHSMRELMNRTSDPKAKDAIRQAVSDIERG
jgi:hypothetical protein